MEKQNKNADFHFDQDEPKKSKVPDEFWEAKTEDQKLKAQEDLLDKPLTKENVHFVNALRLKSIDSSLNTIKVIIVIYFIISLFGVVIWFINNLS